MKYYFIGIKGSGMSTLACLLSDLGNSVVGYDDALGYKFTMDGLINRNIKIYEDNGFDIDCDYIVTYSAAIKESHKEIERCKNIGCKIIKYHDLLGELTNEFNSICVCGTHGKTTTSLMISDVLKDIKPNYFVGDGSGFGNKDSNNFIIESCEFNKHFLSYNPYISVVTNIELDHTETYPNISSLIDTFRKFCLKTKNITIACGDDDNIKKMNIDNVIYYGFNSDNDLVAKNIVIGDKTSFDVYYKNDFYYHFDLPLFGNHMILNSLASIMIGILYDISKDKIYDALFNYKCANRRFNESIVGNNIVIDDYAHHPTEIRVTYESCKLKYPNKKIIGVFLPNTYSRTKDLFDDFVKSLSFFDKCFVMDIMCDRENISDYPDINSDKLIECIDNSEKISIDTCSKLLEFNDSVICFMSCANISHMIDEYKKISNIM